MAEIEKSGVGVPPQLLNLKEPTAVAQLNEPLLGRYWSVYQKGAIVARVDAQRTVIAPAGQAGRLRGAAQLVPANAHA